jgi:hypothetical protein
MAPPWGHVRLSCPDPPLDVTCLLGPEPVKYTGGFSGWEVVQRPGQTSMTQWSGTEPLQFQLGLMLSTYPNPDENVTRITAEIMQVARGDNESPAGIVRVEGIRLPSDMWVIEGIDFGDPYRDNTGRAYRQPMVLSMREYIPPTFANLRKRALDPAKGKTRIVKAKHNDTPAKIAKRFRCKWWELRDRNGMTLRKANQKIAKGTLIRVPARQIKTKRKGGVRGHKKGHD